MSAPFTMYIRVRYGECDAQNVVFNARYADYVDLVATEFMRALPGGYPGLLERQLDTQVVNLNLDWFAPARFDDVLAIQTQVERIGNSSFSLKLAMYKNTPTDDNAANQDSNNKEKDSKANCLLCKASVTYVMVDAKAYTKTPIPEDIKAILPEVGKGKVVDQAGGVG